LIVFREVSDLLSAQFIEFEQILVFFDSDFA
jgi:hypothetical protein